MTIAGTAPRPRRRWIWVLVAVATVSAFVAPFRLKIDVPKTSTHALDPAAKYQRDISSLQVQADYGVMVTIRAGRPGHVTVSGSLSWTLRKPTVTQVWRGGRFLVGATCPKVNPFGSCEASIVIGIPAGTAVQAQAGEGSVSVIGLTGPLHLSATSGLVTVRNISGPAWISVTSGGVVARTGVRSQQFDAVTSTGQLIIDFSSRPRSVAIAIGAGSAVITVPPRARYRIVSSRGAGALYVAPGLRDARSDLVLTATIGTGAARIGYPPGT